MYMGGKKRKGKRLLARFMITIVLMTLFQQGTISSYAAESTEIGEMELSTSLEEQESYEDIISSEEAEVSEQDTYVETEDSEVISENIGDNSEQSAETEDSEVFAENTEDNANVEDTEAENISEDVAGDGEEDTQEVSDSENEISQDTTAADNVEDSNTTKEESTTAENVSEEPTEILVGATAENNDDDPSGESDDMVKILMVGNSLTRYNDVAGKLKSLFALDGVTAQVDTRTQMGASLFDQADILKVSTREAVVNGGYDFVILQEKSSGFSEALLRQGAEAFYPWIQEAASQPQLVFYMPWANEDVLKSMQTTVTDAYVSVARDYNAKLAPAGEAYYELYFDQNKKWYRKGDNVHGNDLASLISASTIYYTITGKDTAFSFTAEEAETLATLVESDDYKNNRVSYSADDVNLIETAALKYSGIYKDLTNVPNLEGRGMDGNTNLAKGKQGSASSNGRGSSRGIYARNVGNLTDGSYTSFLVSHEEDPDIWYAVDFGKSTKLDEVILYFGGTGTYVNTEKSVFTVEMSDSYDSDYRVVANGESTSTDPVDIKFEETEGRYLRVHVSSFSGKYVSMFEIEAYYQRPEDTEEPGGNEDPGEVEDPSEPTDPTPGSTVEPAEDDENVTVKAFPGDSIEVSVGDNTADMSLYDGNMYEGVIPFAAGENTVRIIANGKVIKERTCTATGSSQDVIVRYFADKDKIVTGFDIHYDANGNTVQDIKKVANWTGNFFNRTGIDEFKEFGGWDQANKLSRLDYIGGGAFKRTFSYTVPENSVSYEFKINFDGAWSNGEVPSSNATVTFPAGEKGTDTFVLFVNSITGEWFDSINTGKVTYTLADGSIYEQAAGKANIQIKIEDEPDEMIQTSLKNYRYTKYLPAGDHILGIYVDDQLINETEVKLDVASSVTAIYDADNGVQIVKKDSVATEEPETDDTTKQENADNEDSKGENSANTQNSGESQNDSSSVSVNTEGNQADSSENNTDEIVDSKQKKTSITKLTAGKKAFTVTWKKKKAKSIKGYEIQYSTDKNFEKNVKSVFVKKAKTSKKISKLKNNKKYYVRIRTYKVSGDHKVYSDWSKTKSVRTKKDKSGK